MKTLSCGRPLAFGGTPFFAGYGAYNPATDNILGYYGNDTADNYVWAVINHNSQFAVGQISASPEPSRALLLLAGLSAVMLRRRRSSRKGMKECLCHP